jgi:hypothetical protein
VQLGGIPLAVRCQPPTVSPRYVAHQPPCDPGDDCASRTAPEEVDWCRQLPGLVPLSTIAAIPLSAYLLSHSRTVWRPTGQWQTTADFSETGPSVATWRNSRSTAVAKVRGSIGTKPSSSPRYVVARGLRSLASQSKLPAISARTRVYSLSSAYTAKGAATSGGSTDVCGGASWLDGGGISA